ncbi:ABC transporter ATP-binding protein [Marimonas sp. MJW-29]|uniref:ABC transporter ATP-binding protein n=1 Tax=Sulfitobacter sediminis TaxID=3234186 RepID=A0ABV3RTA6_9RHOB
MMELKSLSKSFDGKPAIVDLSLAVEDDEYLTLLGPSGSGKTTLLRLMAGLDRPDGGQILLNGEDVTYRPTHTRGLGFVQQNYALFPHMTVEDNVGFGLVNRLIDPVTDGAEVRRRVAEMLELVGLEGLGGRMVGQISGGQKQRVSLARTLITQPKVCLLDEPLGALDANLRERMTIELRKIREALGVTFFHVTGNESEAIAMGDRMIVLDDGRAVQIDAPDVVFDTPATVRVARFLNAYNVFSGTSEGGVFTSGDLRLPVPPGVRAESAAVHFDKAVILKGDAKPDEGAAIKATFVASEFMGSKVVYFFRRASGGMVEVERHLSSSDPEVFEAGQEVTLNWNAADTLFYDADGGLIPPVKVKGAA